jgi:hypothetical protein
MIGLMFVEHDETNTKGVLSDEKFQKNLRC